MVRLVYKGRVTSRETRWDKAKLKAFMVVLESKQVYPTVPICYQHLDIVLFSKSRRKLVQYLNRARESDLDVDLVNQVVPVFLVSEKSPVKK